LEGEYAGALSTEMKRPKQFVDQNARLKEIVMGLILERVKFQNVIRLTEGPRSESIEAWSHERTGSRDMQRLGSVDLSGSA
jgi:hypothetical protein